MAAKMDKGISKTSRNNWVRPDPSELHLEFSIAESVLEEFVSSHDPSDVLRELVQNEYDAEDTKVEILFSNDSVTVLGNGKPIDNPGWKRLSVMLGRGRVASGVLDGQLIRQ